MDNSEGFIENFEASMDDKWYKKAIKKYQTKHKLATRRSACKRIIREVCCSQIISAEKDFMNELKKLKNLKKTNDEKFKIKGIIDAFSGEQITEFTRPSLFLECIDLPLSKKNRRWMAIWKRYILCNIKQEDIPKFHLELLDIELPISMNFSIYDKKDVVFA